MYRVGLKILCKSKRLLPTYFKTKHYIMDHKQDAGLLAISRLMQPNDANVYGNVHGGIVLKLIEEAGLIISTKHCNSVPNSYKKSCAAVLARVERTDFLQPMYVGEVSHLHAKLTYASKHSLEVMVEVTSENIITGTKRLTNKATLWYVSKADICSVPVPPILHLSESENAAGYERYYRQKQQRNNDPSPLFDEWTETLINPTAGGEDHTVQNAYSTLVHFVNSTDCGLFNKLPGGYAMKLMDEVAGITAIRHCRTPCVTASMDATNFHKSVSAGTIINVRGRPIFTSNKSIIIQVVIVCEIASGTDKSSFCACSAFFTYVSLDKDGKTLQIPPLKLVGEDEKLRFEEGRKMYLAQKSARNSNLSK